MTIAPPRPARPARSAPAPRWAHWAAHAAALTVLPSSLWRLGLAFGQPMGYTEAGHRELVGTGWTGPVYLVALAVLSEIAALLTFGLVHRWGEVVPAWVPVAGGRALNPKGVVLAAGTGVVVLAALWTPFLFWWAIPDERMTGPGHLLVGFVYLPLVAWAPLLAAVTVSYHRRHRHILSMPR